MNFSFTSTSCAGSKSYLNKSIREGEEREKRGRREGEEREKRGRREGEEGEEGGAYLSQSLS
jgi:hypothetical protein